MTELDRTPFQIMTEENERQARETDALLEKIVSECSSSLGPLIHVEPENNSGYNDDTPQEQLYLDLARLNYRTVIFVHSAINPEYLRSTLPLYDAIISLVGNVNVRNVAEAFKELVENKLRKFEGF